MATVDIIIPVYNREVLVRDAIESALHEAQNVSLEIVVVDDAWNCAFSASTIGMRLSQRSHASDHWTHRSSRAMKKCSG
jgi:Glycosyl transferase family 2.